MRLSERVKRLEIAIAPSDLPPVAAFLETRADGEAVTATSLAGSQVPVGLTVKEFETWAAERGLRPFTITFTEPKPRHKPGE